MITKGNRRGGQPILIQQGKTISLQRIPLEARTFNESWIQQLIYNNPEILPVSEIESGFSPVIPIGREVATPVGYIDNLFISPDGYLTIVETKLWRNPEARREVVGQIIDYAKELKRWSYDELDNSVKVFNRLYNSNSDGVLETVRRHTELDEHDEQFFIDNISKNLQRGRFLLLIVGDGIRESVEEMVEYLSQSPQLYFTPALVELQVYDIDCLNNSFMVIPQLITRTKEITRAIVKVEAAKLADLKITIETDLGTETTKQLASTVKRLTITAEDFFEQLSNNTGKDTVEFARQLISDCEALGLFTEWNTGSFSIKFPDPKGSGVKIGILNVDRNGLFYLGFSKPQFEKLKLPLEISYGFALDTAAMLPGIHQNQEKKHIWNKYSTLTDLKKVYPEFMVRVRQYIGSISAEG